MTSIGSTNAFARWAAAFRQCASAIFFQDGVEHVTRFVGYEQADDALFFLPDACRAGRISVGFALDALYRRAGAQLKFEKDTFRFSEALIDLTLGIESLVSSREFIAQTRAMLLADAWGARANGLESAEV